MSLPIPLTFAPMDAKLVPSLPLGKQWQYEPKWDGFRCLAFRDGKNVHLQSKSGQPLSRYFPEIVEPLGALKPTRFVIDAELVVPQDDGLSFDALLQRIHPAATRIRKLSMETPAVMICFDLLVDDKGVSIAGEKLTVRRKALERFAGRFLSHEDRIVLSPATRSLKTANKWYAGIGATLDGVVAKRLDLPYQSGNRLGMVKVKNLRTADCVVGGYRDEAKGEEVGSLLLGLYNADGSLDHVGFCSAFSAEQRKKLRPMLKTLMGGAGFTGRAPGGPSRWSTARSAQWQPLDHTLVVEVQYDHFTEDRFRHGTKFLRWRPDKSPRKCTLDQVRQETHVSPLHLLTQRVATTLT